MKTEPNRSPLKTDPGSYCNKLPRRDILKASLAGGGLVIAFSLDHSGVIRKAMASDQFVDELFEPNGLIQISPDGTILLYAKNAEIGQGVKTSLPMIVAEELDAAWTDVTVEQAPVDPSVYGRQNAGGSMSVTTSWDMLRKAGAVARAMLVSAAASRWDVAEIECQTANSTVLHSPSGQRLSYSELALEASRLAMPDPDTVRLKQRDEYSLMGTRVRDVDIEKTVSGQLKYTSDVVLPGMVYGMIEKCPARGGTVVAANLDHVRSLNGVLDAFILEGAGDVRAERMPGVAIVAENTWAAMKAKSALEVEWDETNASKDSWSRTVAAAHDRVEQRGDDVILKKGNADAAFANATQVVKSSYTYPFLAHATMEPQNFVAWHKGDQIELWSGTQAPTRAVKQIARLFDFPEEKIKINQLRAGGGFGRRGRYDFACDAVAISERVGAPVKLQWSREDDMRNDHYRPGGVHHLAGAINEAGKLTAIRDHFVTLSENGKSPMPVASMGADTFPAPVMENVDYTQSFLPWTIPTGAWRAPLANAFGFVFQSFLHEVAVAAGRDHLEFLLDMLGEPRWLEPGNKGAMNTGRAAEVIKLAAEKADWGRDLPDRHALGLGFYFSHFSHVAEVAEVSITNSNELTIHKVTVVADVGPIVNLSGAEGQCEGSVIDGISSMMQQNITIENGRVLEGNFDSYPLLKIAGAPEVEVHFIQSEYEPTGLGEPALPPLIPAIANAVFSASGQRIRSLPLSLEGLWV